MALATVAAALLAMKFVVAGAVVLTIAGFCLVSSIAKRNFSSRVVPMEKTAKPAVFGQGKKRAQVLAQRKDHFHPVLIFERLQIRKEGSFMIEGGEAPHKLNQFLLMFPSGDTSSSYKASEDFKFCSFIACWVQLDKLSIEGIEPSVKIWCEHVQSREDADRYTEQFLQRLEKGRGQNFSEIIKGLFS